MPRLPVVTGGELIRALERVGFVAVRQRGSHVQLRRVDPAGNITTFPVPVHSGRTLKRGTLLGILRKAGVEPDDLRRML
jgi:predicted RNA binding protein YcfA (HicA-like mRNA interferase family)